MKQYLYTIRFPIIAALVNSLIYQFTWPTTGGLVVFSTIRILIAIWAGYAIVKSKVGAVAIASFAGPILLFFDHVFIGGTLGVITHDFSQLPANVLAGSPFENQPRLAYFLGVLLSFLMFFPVAMAVAAGGGLLARLDERRASHR